MQKAQFLLEPANYHTIGVPLQNYEGLCFQTFHDKAKLPGALVFAGLQNSLPWH